MTLLLGPRHLRDSEDLARGDGQEGRAEGCQSTHLGGVESLASTGKGHLGVGADADLSVLEGFSGKTFGVISGGQVIMLDGHVVGKDTTILTTPQGLGAAKGRNLKAEVVDLESGWFYGGRPMEV